MAATSTVGARARRASRTDGIRLQPPARTSRSMGTPAVPRCERRVAACAVLWSSAARDLPRGRRVAPQVHGDVVVRHREAGDADVAAAVATVGERVPVDPAAAVLVVGAEEAQHPLEDQPGAHPGQQPRRARDDVGVDRDTVGGELAHDVGVGNVRAGHEERLRRAEAVHRGCRGRGPRCGGRHGVVVAGDGQHGTAGRRHRVVGAHPPGRGAGADQLGHEAVADPQVREGGPVRGVGVDVEEAGAPINDSSRRVGHRGAR